MTRSLCFRLFIATTTVWCISAIVIAEPIAPKTLDDVFAPVVVGTPPVNAFNGLFCCPDGEIRHYGDDGFLFSRDNGLTWKHRRFGEVDAAGQAAGGGRPLGMNPKTGTCLRLVGGTGGMFIHRSTDGPDGQYNVQKVDDRRLIMVRPPYFLRSRPRVLFAGHGDRPAQITAFRSEDDERTWIGFREMRLNPLRNSGDFGSRASHDFSVHQPQALELPKQCLETNARLAVPEPRKTQPLSTNQASKHLSRPLSGKILVAHGQDEEVRALVIFDPKWLYEPRRRSTFENDLTDWSAHKYSKGIVGHCAYNRVPGPRLVPHPDKAGAKVLQIRHPVDPKLVFDKDGAVWNFPAAVRGSFSTRMKLLPGGGGGRICLVDRWFNPTDPVVQDYSMYVLTIPGDGRLGDDVSLVPGRWHELRCDWNDSQSSVCQFAIDGTPTPLTLPLVRPSVNGISYVHFQALAEEEDLQGFLIESVDGGKAQ